MSGESDPRPEVRLQGIGVAPGIAQGVALVHAPDEDEAPSYPIREEDIPGEIARLRNALAATRAQISESQQRIADAIGAKDAGIFDAHLLVVEDQTLIDEVLRLVREQRRNIEHVYQQVANGYARTLSEIDDPYLRERALDIHDVTRRVLRNLLGKSPRTLATAEHPHLLVAADLTPSDTAQMNRALVLGFATDAGSRTSHTAIMARSLDLPAVVGLHDATGQIATGDPILIDGYSGLVFIRPSERTLYEYGEIENRKTRVEEQLTHLRDTAANTRDGRHIVLSANIELPEDVGNVVSSGAEGIGLYRTEFFFLNQVSLPDEEEQYQNYLQVARAIHPHKVIIRTLDLGGDKIAQSLGESEEQNPFLGWRAIRLCLERTDLFKQQLRAMLRASAEGGVRIMYPMISGLGELRRANAILDECRRELRAEGKAFAENLEVGAMIEVPSAAVTADLLASEVDFFSIGTNDLIQYTIAVDRLNERIAHLYEPTHPAILRMIRGVTEAAHARGKWVGVCGEVAGEVSLTPLLIGLGIDELSVGAATVPAVKRAIQALNTEECRGLADEALSDDDPVRILERSAAHARARYPELFE
jgi:phosphotransferase system enzyme I (PtsI)